LPELFPVLEVENTTPELLALTGWRTAWQNIQQNAVAAQVSAVQLSNPLGSGVIAAVTRIYVAVNSVTNVQMSLTDALFTSAAIRGLFRDSRFGGNRATALELRSDPNIATAAGLRIILNTTNEIFEIRDDNGLAVLTPGTALQIGSVDVNLVLQVNYFWRERLAQPSEFLFP
jgi:hypothetical protein